jgi:hypothetical protein
MLASVLRLPPAVRFRLAFTSFLFAIATVVNAAPPQQSISTSRQFIVYGTEIGMRGAICDLAERTKRDLLTLLDQRDAWTTPIVINAQYPQANLPELPRLAVNLSQTGFGLKLQLDLTIDAEISRPEVRRELLRALLLEMIYRGESNIPAGTAYASPPDWLLDGVPALQSDMPLDRVSSLLAMPVAARSVLPLEKFLHQRPDLLDAPGRLLYRAYSRALVYLLRHAPEGPARLTRFIGDVRSASNDPMAELRKHFPGLFDSSDGAERVWERQIARLSTEQPYELLPSAETERRLDAILSLKFSDQGATKIYQLADFPRFLKHPSAKTALALLAHDLRQLATRANPVYRPIIAEYAEVTARLTRGKTKGAATRLERLRGSRQAVAAQMREIDDYLNWFEATSLQGASGAFADYIKAAEVAARPPQTKRDPISVYLDVLETQFEN